MSTLFALPDVGEGLTEADIVAWKVAPGDTVTVNQVLVEIETAKSLVELPSPQAGVITGLLVNEGQTVEVGTPIVEFDGGTGAAPGGSGTAGTTGAEAPAGSAAVTAAAVVGAAAGAAPGTAAGAAAVAPAEAGDGPNLVGYGSKAGSKKRRPRKAGAPVAGAATAVSAGAAAPAAAAPLAAALPAAGAQSQALAQNPAGTSATAAGSTGSRPLAKPPVRKAAKDAGVDLSLITPTGAHGEVTRADFEAFLAGGAAGATSGPVAAAGAGTAGAAGASATVGGPAVGQSAARDANPAELQERMPFKGVTKFMAQAMATSAFTAPHVTEFLEVDATGTMDFVRTLKAGKVLGEGVKVTPLLVVARAVIWAALRNPRINSCFDGDDILIKHYINLGIAAATPRGLIVPNIKRADALGLEDLARELRALTNTAREGRTTPAAQAGGTITITNVGVFGVDTGTPIINPGEAAIVAFGAIKQKPWVVDGQLAVREVTTLAVSADHRLVDGEVISKFLADLGRAVEDPRIMLL
ncbi:2-oxo acid dehydrogenase subunit E2 [Brevibacterium sp. 50QC2O2]|uniref:dihydrolipoamide acetyltransferase family protein n=1 Tax=Brevibacterium sp. 50QC2O2 TaxID=2968459 RepID=UPI00211C88AC|nr:dihydrolipoamide acetyltransferase family protein [Brevibacterium sp. 50QC2O2]MCQ9388640.1 2-oxo acid dehydrogenase subunit E2 [Brevibacterium sp. 50QC2O2]